MYGLLLLPDFKGLKVVLEIFKKYLDKITNFPPAAVVETTVGRQLKPIKSWELPNKKITENHILTDRFINFYCLYEEWQIMFYFFKELQVFLFSLIHISCLFL